MTFRAPEGTRDVLPPQAEIADPEERWRNTALWHRLEDAARASFERFGYEEIRPPILEYTSLFQKSSGDTTDIVEKEMFTFGRYGDFIRRARLVLWGYEAPSAEDVESPDPQARWEQDAPTLLWGAAESALEKRLTSGEAVFDSLARRWQKDRIDFWTQIAAEEPSKHKALVDLLTEYLREDREDLSLRPELTPGAIRALVENGLFAKRQTWKVWYFGPAFRKERPQKGRFRQFTQLGVEAVGTTDPLVDAETMILFAEILEAVGVASWKLRINSLGCPECRGGYREVLKKAVQPILPTLCANCTARFERNVFRILDCKADAERTAGLPAAIDHACGKCRAHMAGVEGALRDAKVEYRVDPRIVRGLDYYTRTVYEFSSSALGSQNALCGGGRYDTLVRDMGGPDVGSVGFAAGAERILLAMKGAAAGRGLDFFGVAVAEEQRAPVFRAVTELRRAGLSGDMDFEGRSLKAQMRSANRSGAQYAILIGPEEAAQGKVKLKNMKEGAERLVSLDEARAALLGGKK
jgi:histidyl-tRNA synthetase